MKISINSFHKAFESRIRLGIMSALAVNDKGQVVGWSGTGENNSRAFFWQDGFMLDLNSLLPAGSGWHLIEARGINNQGMIVGTAMINGASRAFLLAPPSAQRLRNSARREALPPTAC